MGFARATGALLLALTGSFAATALAMQETDLKACTNDNQTATLHLTLNDGYMKAHPDLMAQLQTAFTETANGMSGAELRKADPGAKTFMATIYKVAPDWIDALDLTLDKPPTLTPGCTIK